MNKQALVRLILLIALLGISTTSLTATQQERIAAGAGLDQKIGDQIPLGAHFRDEHGHSVELGGFFGRKPVILALAYYECPNLCTLVLNGLLETAQNLKLDAGKDYQIVVVSFDSKEGPGLAAAKKQTYVQRYARPGGAEGWHFLTGNDAAIIKLANAVGFGFADDKETRQFAHPSTIIVLTPEGKVARYFPGIEYPAAEVRLALVEASQNRTGSLADRIFLLCFHYNPQTGKYGLLIGRLMKITGIGTAVGLGCFIVINIRRERPLAT